ncbi:copper chaperone CopZ [Oscillospiraceae bacterium CM]|nr:copper chaperone CopZ [Oscillospiraceae bacterium CM]
MEKITLNVEGMSCGHCVARVEKAVTALPGVLGVAVSLESKTVTVEFDPAAVAESALKEAIEEQGYDVM